MVVEPLLCSHNGSVTSYAKALLPVLKKEERETLLAPVFLPWRSIGYHTRLMITKTFLHPLKRSRHFCRLLLTSGRCIYSCLFRGSRNGYGCCEHYYPKTLSRPYSSSFRYDTSLFRNHKPSMDMPLVLYNYPDSLLLYSENRIYNSCLPGHL